MISSDAAVAVLVCIFGSVPMRAIVGQEATFSNYAE